MQTGPRALTPGSLMREEGRAAVRHPLAREIGLTLIFKILALAAMFAFFFSPSDRVSVDDRSMERTLTAPAPGSGEQS